jgi:SanA protein
MEVYRKFLKLVVLLFSIVMAFILFANVWIIGSTRDQVIDIQELDSELRTILILGTSYNTVDGEKNEFFQDRMITASTIYEKGMATEMILSGSTTKYYNEPVAMRKSLNELHVPDSILIDDDGGLRTLDSVIRCKELFKKNEVIIITQRFHAYRALFISNFYDLDAVVVITQTEVTTNSMGVLLREFLARPLAVLDLYVLHSKPKFETVIINHN